MTVLHGHPVAIVLAAGRSRRFGRNKLVEPVDGLSLIERVVSAFVKARKVREVVVVHGPEQEREYSWLAGPHVHLVENPAPENGMITSIRAALRSPHLDGKDFLIHPADVPFVPDDLIDRLVSTFLARPCRIVIPTYRGLGGHPGMYAADLAQEFFLRGDRQGAREILLRHQRDTVRLAVHDPDVCFDVDAPEDLKIAADAGARWARVEAKVEARRPA
jgi:molybdenum cofactor cytidylyltransferase